MGLQRIYGVRNTRQIWNQKARLWNELENQYQPYMLGDTLKTFFSWKSKKQTTTTLSTPHCIVWGLTCKKTCHMKSIYIKSLMWEFVTLFFSMFYVTKKCGKYIKYARFIKTGLNLTQNNKNIFNYTHVN